MPAFLVLDSISLATPDGRPLFDGLTLAIGRERTGIVGRNGCGKSTLLSLIAGEIEPAGGSLERIGSYGELSAPASFPPNGLGTLCPTRELPPPPRLPHRQRSLGDPGRRRLGLSTPQ